MVAVNPGITDLEAWWDCADLTDSQGSNDLTDSNGVSFVGDGADFERGSSQHLFIADNASLSFGNESFSLVCRVKFEEHTTPNLALMAKNKIQGDAREYSLSGKWSAEDIEFGVSSDGGSVNAVGVTHGTIVNGNWMSIVAVHDSVANTVTLYVDDDGNPQSAGYALGCNDGGETFRLGAWVDSGGSVANFFDGIMSFSAIYRRVITADEVEWLHNSGNGRSYADLITYRPQVMIFS